MQKKSNTFIQFILYTLIGLSSTAVQYLAYVLVLFITDNYLPDNYHLANLAGFLLSVLNSFLWNQRFVFKCGQDERRNPLTSLLKTYIMYAGTGVALTSVLLYIFIELIGMSRYTAPLLIVVMIYPLNFIISKFWAYRTEKKKP